MPSLEEDVSVFDLPNLRSQPTFEVLQQTLQKLELKPTSWDSTIGRPKANEAALSRYFTAIISNLFEWFDEVEGDKADIKREILWELASKRMTERCGRSAMGELNRTWTIPKSKDLPELSFTVREPPLTGDNLGLKTWGTAFTIAKRLEYFHGAYLKDALGADSRVLELGAGTGLVGIAAAAVWSCDILMTDLAEIQENLKHNITQNLETVRSLGGSASAQVLDWKSKDGLSGTTCQEYDIVIAVDSIYDDDHPELVTNMIAKYLKHSPKARALVAVPLRDKNTVRMVEDLKHRIKACMLGILHEGREEYRDDWELEGDESAQQCWWAILCRSQD